MPDTNYSWTTGGKHSKPVIAFNSSACNFYNQIYGQNHTHYIIK